MITLHEFKDSFGSKAKIEYFIKFLKIEGVDGFGKSYSLTLSAKNISGSSSEKILFCSKVKVGETLEQAVKRTLFEEFGIEKVNRFYALDLMDSAKNRFGAVLPRCAVYVEVEYKELKFDKFQNYFVRWVENRTTEKDLLGTRGAREYILSNKNQASGFGGNRFQDNAECQEFVQELYDAGAVEVRVQNISEDVPGEEYADLLIVKMPWDPEKRKAFLTIYNTECKREHFEPDTERGQEELLFWWD